MRVVVDSALLHIFVGNGIGLVGVKLEIGGGGVEVGCGGVEFGQHRLQILCGDILMGEREEQTQETLPARFSFPRA